MSRFFGSERLLHTKKPAQHLIAKVPLRRSRVEMTIGIDLGDVWSHYCTLNEAGEVVDRGRFRTNPKEVEKWFTDVPPARGAMEAGTHSIWISEQLQELGHDVIVANVRELRAISHSDRKSDQVDSEKLARFAPLDPKILRPIAHRTVQQQEALTLIRARDLIVPAAPGGGERRTRPDEILRLSDAGFFDTVFRGTQPGSLPPGLAHALELLRNCPFFRNCLPILGQSHALPRKEFYNSVSRWDGRDS